MFLLHFLLFLGYPVIPIFIIGLLYWSNFITPDVHNLGYSSSHVLLLTYFIFWSPILDQYFISLFIFLGLYTSPIFIFNVFNLGLLYRTVFLDDFGKTCPARCSLALCNVYFRPLPPPLWGSFAARFFFFPFSYLILYLLFR